MVKRRYAAPAFAKKFDGKTYTRTIETFKTRGDARWDADRRRKYGQLARVFKRSRGEYYVYTRGTPRHPRADE